MKTLSVSELATRALNPVRPLFRNAALLILLTVGLSTRLAAEPVAGRKSPEGIWTTDADLPITKKGKKPSINAKKFHTTKVNFNQLKATLAKAPMEFTADAKDHPLVITLPMPDGSFARFQVEESPIFGPEMVKKFPQIKTYGGRGVDDPTATLRMDITKKGFRAQVISGNGTFYIDPYDVTDTEYCMTYQKRDVDRTAGFLCGTDPIAPLVANKIAQPAEPVEVTAATTTSSTPPIAALTHGTTRRTYRLVVSATGEYTQFHGGTINDGISAIATSVNRINGVYERELSIRLTLVNTMVYTNPNTDPFDESDSDGMFVVNQNFWDSYGSDKYDIGHVFGVNISSQAARGVCQSGIKAKGVTGRGVGAGGPINDPYDVDYVAHEIGHQFGANHTFNSTAGACSGNRVASKAYEPGSGTTIMAYAGICNNSTVNDDVQTFSDPFFHWASLEEIRNYITPGVGLGDCPTAISTGNSVPTVSGGPNYTIPGWTPFVLTATGSDPDGDILSYSWEQRDLGPAQTLNATDNGASPLFRSLVPNMSGRRVFPQFAERGTNVAFGDRIPMIDRVMQFRVTARDQRTLGAFATDDVQLTVEASAGPFYVQTPNGADVWAGGSYQSIEWEVNNTDIAPINCSSVQILLSTDDGLTYPYVLANFADNDGYEERIAIPALTTTSTKCRIMVKANNNIFFDVSDAPFTITAAAAPANDNKASATSLGVATSGTRSNDNNINATKESGEPLHWHNAFGSLYSGGRSVWYTWSPSAGGAATFDLTAASQIFGVLAVYETGTDWNGLKIPSIVTAQGGTNVTFNAQKNRTYCIVVDGLHDQDFGSFTLQWSMVVDSTPPVVSFSPLTNQASVFNFSQLGGTVNEQSTVKFVIEEFNPGGTNRYWSGTEWTVSNNSRRETVMTGNSWTPASGTLPTRGQTRYGPYLVYAYATDPAGNQGEANIVLSRTAADTTPPEVFANIDEGQVFTNNFLPPIQGLAGDPESGVDLVTVYLMRPATGGGFEYWNGSSWTSSGTEITATYDQFVWSLPIAQPSGSNLRNGSYSLQVSARNQEVPASTRSISVNFTVDYHPVYTWTAGSFSDSNPNNNNNNWSNPANWNMGDVPPTNAVVIINGGDPDATSMGSVNIYGVNLNGGTLITSGMLVKKLNVLGGRLAGGTVLLDANGGTFVWGGGKLQPGNFTIPAGANMSITNSVHKELYDGSINNYGTITWHGGHIYGSESFFTNHVGATFDIKADAVLGLYPNFGSGNRGVYNYGLVRKSAGTESWTQGKFINYGEIQVQTGSFSIYDYMAFQNGSKISGAGKVKAINGCCGFTGEIFGTTILSGTFEFGENNTRLRPAVGSSATLVITNGGTLNLSQGALGGNGNLTLVSSGSFLWTGGVLDGTNTISAGTVLNASGANWKTLGSGAVLNNLGTINWNGSAPFYQDGRSGYGYTPGKINNSGLFRVQNDGDLFYRDGDATVFNNLPGATFIKDGGTNLTLINDFVFNNHGHVRAKTGTMHFDDGASIPTYFYGGSYIHGDGGNVKMNGNVILSGTVYSDCPIELAGRYLTGSTNAPTYAGPGPITWTGGFMAGELTFETNTVVNITGPTEKFLNSGVIVTNRGHFTWSGAGRVYNYGRSAYNETPCRFENMPGATFAVLTDGMVFESIGAWSVFNNQPGAVFAKSGGTNTYFGTFEFNNRGDINVQGGRLELNGLARFYNNSTLTGGQVWNMGGNVYCLGTNILNNALFKFVDGDFWGTTNNLASIRTTNGAAVEWAGGRFQQIIHISPNSVFNLSGPATKQFGNFAVLNNEGTATWSGTGEIFSPGRPAYGESPCTWNNLSGSVFSATGDAIFNHWAVPSVFNNNAGALFQKIGGTNATTIHWSFNNHGIVRAAVGKLQFATDGLSTGSFQTDAGAAIQFISGVNTVNGGQFTGAGKIQVVGGTLLTAGNIQMGNGLVSGTIEVLSGTLGGVGTFVGTPVFDWTGGSISGAQTISAGSVLNISGAATKSLAPGSVFNNYGTVNWSGPGVIFASARGAYNESPSVFNNAPGAVFRMLTDGTVFVRDGNYSTFNNLPGALFVKSGGTNESLINAFIFNNGGQVRAEAGTLAFNDIMNLNGSSLLQGQSRIRLAGQTTASNTVEFAGTILQDAGTLTGAISNGIPLSRFTGSATYDWTGGTILGNVTLGSNIVMNIRDPGTIAVSKELGSAVVLNNDGQINWTGPGKIWSPARAPYNELPSKINNRPGAKFRMLTDGVVFERWGDFSEFNNYAGATFEKIGGTNNTIINSFKLINDGELKASIGTIEYHELTVLRTNGVFSGSGLHVLNTGTHTMRGTSQIVNSRLRFNDGVLFGETNGAIATISGGLFEWTGGWIRGELALTANSTMEITGNVTKALDSATVFRNYGQVRWTGSGNIWSDGRPAYGYSPAAWHNEAGSVFTIENSALFDTWTLRHSFHNKAGARLVKRNNAGTTVSHWNLFNNGTIELNSGKIQISDARTFAADDKFVFTLGGTNGLSDSGRFSLDGAATLNGFVSVILTNGYVPANGDSFTLFTYPSRSGQFAGVALPSLPYPLQWKTTYGPTAMTLTVERAHLFDTVTKAANGQVQLNFSGPAASSIILQASTNLVNWSGIFTNTPFTGNVQLVDPQAGLHTNRFYRVVIVP